ncbi:hypothetical protein GJ496_005335 [Pomphorhynchus laevis]|nr:hypothetical protein GJ496_005335 [Pomphorhynchus laevis]
MLASCGASSLSGFHGTSALLTLLSDPCPEIQAYAVQKLVTTVSRQWFEIADYLPRLEQLRENENFPERKLVALVLSMVYYYLNEHEEALNYALEAGSKFDITSQSEYVQSVLSYCMDQYSAIRSQNYIQEQLVKSTRRFSVYKRVDEDLSRPVLSSHYPLTGDDYVDLSDEEIQTNTTIDGSVTTEDTSTTTTQQDLMATSEVIDACRESSDQYERSVANFMTMDPRLETIVNRLIEKCIGDNKLKQAVGICLESKRLDALQRVIELSANMEDTLNYVIECVPDLLSKESRNWHHDVLDLVVNIYTELPSPNYFKIVKCFIQLGEPKSLSNLLLSVANDCLPLSLQLAFDIYESSSQQFRSQVISCMECERDRLISQYRAEQSKDNQEGAEESSEVAAIEEDSSDSNDTLEMNIKQNEDIVCIDRVLMVLSSSVNVNLLMQFLIRNNHADLHLLKYIKDHTRNMLCHSAVVIANGFMHCGTTCDQFLRDNLEWLGNATNWARFTATASLGVIHRYHEKEALRLMDAYLPKHTSTLSPYAEGGGLYALGLIFANHGNGEIIKYLEDSIRESSNPVVKHGGTLGLGLLTLGTNNRHVLSLMKEMLSMNDAIVGEAVAIGMGMVMIGSRSRSTLSELICQVEETQHEKIARGASVGIALLCFNQREGCTQTIRTLYQSNNIFLRRAGMYATAMAWMGSGHNGAIRKLLHFAVSDVSDDVRRAAVESLGFVMHRQSSEKTIGIISLLVESYNPHVRYGSVMALGIAFAGTGNQDAIKLIEPLTNDPVTFVRLGCFLSQAMIISDLPEASCSYAKTFRQMLTKVISDKHEDLMTKYGAILAQGIVDACGRNASITLHSPSTNLNCPQGAAGVLMFLHFWFWFPLTHMLSIAFKPSAVICVTDKLQAPEMEIWTSLSSAHFAYPTSLAEQRRGTDKGEKVEAAVLSIRQRTGRQSKSNRLRHHQPKDSITAAATSASSSSKTSPAASNIIMPTSLHRQQKDDASPQHPQKEEHDQSPAVRQKHSDDNAVESTRSNVIDKHTTATSAAAHQHKEKTPSLTERDETASQLTIKLTDQEKEITSPTATVATVLEKTTSPASHQQLEKTLTISKSPKLLSSPSMLSEKDSSHISGSQLPKSSDKSQRLLKLRNLAVIRKIHASSIVFPSKARFRPIYLEVSKSNSGSDVLPRTGFIVVVDKKPEAGNFKLMRMMKSSALPKEDPKEPDPPEPFEYMEGDEVKNNFHVFQIIVFFNNETI